MNEENIKKLVEDKNNFLKLAEKIKDKFDGPSSYFYLRTIEKTKKFQEEYKSLLEDNSFFEYLYATLTSWGMHRMDKNTRMTNFENFKESILKNKEKIIKLSKLNLMEVNLDEFKEDILEIFNSLKIMSRKDAPKFVANSKIMHFLLPNLIPPMDKGHITYFFYGRVNDKGKKYIPSIKNEEETFWEVLKKFQEIAQRLKLTKKDLINDWDTSIPKIIDNAIIGFNIR